MALTGDNNSADYEEALMATVNDIWATYDKDGNGNLCKTEMRAFIATTLGQVDEAFGKDSRPTISDEEFEAIFREFDIDESGTIEKDEMAILVKRMAQM